MNVGFIGLGTMGSAIAANILRAGHDLTVWNRSTEAVDALVAQGAIAAKSPADAMQGDCMFSMLAHDAAMREVGLDGPMLDHAVPGLVHANLATISVELARYLADAHEARGVGYIASPVFGRADFARDGKLIIVAAGPAALIERLRPLFAAIGRRTAVVGETPEKANLFKIAGNFLLAAAIESYGEALALVRKGGIDPAFFHEVLTNSLFAAPVYQGYGAMMISEKFEPAGFALRLGAKDVDLALAAGKELNVPLPVASLVRDHLIEAMVSGLGEKDWGALGALIAAKAGLPSRDHGPA